MPPDAPQSPIPPGVNDEMARVYDHLRSVARSYLSPAGNSLQPTALVHEAYLRLADRDRESFNDETHFVCAAAKLMRHVLVDYARARRADKRGGGWSRVTLDGLGNSGDAAFDAVDISDALATLEELAPRQARMVELRFFGGMPTETIAEVLQVSERTVRNDWRFARAWLRAELLDRSTEAEPE
ncbi:MAG: ECF-type sigma factor [Phycisphaerales bacterium JB040]